MDIVLLTISGLSLTLAVVMAVILLRVMRDERERSEARVALLAAAAARLESPLPLRTIEVESPETALPVNIEAHELFVQEDVPSPWGRRLAVAAGLAACVALVAYALVPGSRTDAGARPTSAAAPLAPLELLTLRHVQNAGSLTITGLVHNPRNGAPISQASATALLFAQDGSLIADGRAALDFTTLAPGDECPFLITVPVTAAVARYRIGFRGPDGSVIAHVDRRTDGSSARNADLRGSTPWAH